MNDDSRFRGDDDDPPVDPALSDPGLVLAARLRGLEDDDAGGVQPPSAPVRELTRDEKRAQQQALASSAPPFEAPGAGLAESSLAKPLTIVLALVLVGVLGVIVYPYIFNRKEAAPTPVAGSTGTSDSAGTLHEIKVDDAMELEAAAAVKAGNEALKAAGLDAYAYRVSLLNHVEPGKLQRVTLRAHFGGSDAEQVVSGGQDSAFKAAIDPFLAQLMTNQGVEALLLLVNTQGKERPGIDDFYVQYGYYYGLEHMDELQPVIDALETYREQNGQYPHTLDPNIAGTRLHTKGGYFFESEGLGYLPVFKTDSDGSIKMGSGSGIARYNPESADGYVLVAYLDSEKDGLDVHSAENLVYYSEKIAPFPYQAPRGITNVKLAPDGKPDGIAAVIRNGELLK